MTTACTIGVDVGTSGCRAVAITASGESIAEAMVPLQAPVRLPDGGVEQDPELWWQGLLAVLRRIGKALDGRAVKTLCLDGTSATLLLCEPDGAPLGPALMYNDCRAREQAARIAAVAPDDSPARGASSSLAKLLFLRDRYQPRQPVLALNQADWLCGRLLGEQGASDWNNGLKLGFDPALEAWPDWLDRLDLAPIGLPRCHRPGAVLGTLAESVCAQIGWMPGVRVSAGTTDSTAAVLATGAASVGDAVTSLGSTLVLKIVSDRPVSSPEYGVYSHRIGRLWLVGGASNTGGAVLRQYFDDARIQALSAGIDPSVPSGLDYYPLPGPGERFPRNDPTLQPRLSPRPTDDRRFLHGLLEGIARIEAAGYKRLAALDAPSPRRVLTIGGGAGNPIWTAMRQRLLGRPVLPAQHRQPAYGAALLALGREL
jgi:sugar (pentulose or hexulose) kinase